MLFTQHDLSVTSADGDVVSVAVGERALVDGRWLVINGVTSINIEGQFMDHHVSEMIWSIGQQLERSDCDPLDQVRCGLQVGCPATYSEAVQVAAGSCATDPAIYTAGSGVACGFHVVHYESSTYTGAALYDPSSAELVGWWRADDVGYVDCAGSAPASCNLEVSSFDPLSSSDFDEFTLLCEPPAMLSDGGVQDSGADAAMLSTDAAMLSTDAAMLSTDAAVLPTDAQ